MAATFFVVPQWQGAGSSRAMRLVDGAEAIRGDLPSTSTVTVEVPLGAGSDEGTTVHRLSSIRLVRDALRAALESHARANPGGLAVTIGGDCGVALGAVQHALSAHPEVAVLWLDAHPDLNTPETSPSSAFGGMTLRTLLGDGVAPLLEPTALRADRVVLAGIRNYDDAEVEFLENSPITVLEPATLDAASVAEALRASGATSLFIHVDVDVLDPSELAGVADPMPFGISLTTLLDVLAAATATLPLVGASIAGFAPQSVEAAADDLGSILRVIGALTSKR